MKHVLRAITVCALTALVLGALPASAAQVAETYEFALDTWHEIEETDGPVTLHRVRLSTKEGRVTKSSLMRPHNHEYLDTVSIVLEYTNESSKHWKSRITVEWLDEDGVVIDGFGANESLEKKSARRVAKVSLATLTYGLDRAKTLRLTVDYNP